MTQRAVTDTEAAIAERARNVLPAGGFGNVTFDIVIREGRGGRAWDEITLRPSMRRDQVAAEHGTRSRCGRAWDGITL